MNKMTIKIGFSPCPNDTYMLAALVNKWIDTGDYTFEYVIEDIADLNDMAINNKLDVTKLSFYAYTKVLDQYCLLDAGSALGKGCGPLLIAKDPKWASASLESATVAIPGANTTANMLLTLAHPEIKIKTEMLFSDIEKAILNNQVDLGLIIHENRFTYESKGLFKIVDLGDYWEKTTGTAIPLGGFVIKKQWDSKTKKDLERLIRESIIYADNNYEKVKPYIKSLSQELDDHVIEQHINLYVNEYSKKLGIEGMKSIDTLFNKLEESSML